MRKLVFLVVILTVAVALGLVVRGAHPDEPPAPPGSSSSPGLPAPAASALDAGRSESVQRLPVSLPTSTPVALSAPVEPASSPRDRRAMDCDLDGKSLSCGDCQTDRDCAPNEACVTDGASRRTRCVASECASDAECAQASTCVTVSKAHGVRLCIAAGTQAEGATCALDPRDASQSCAQGLRCHLGFCTRPCTPGAATGCPGQSACVETPDGFTCTPSCASPCPDGTRCVNLDASGRISFCGQQRGENCYQTGCANGGTCRSRFVASEGRVTFSCERSCQMDDSSTCPEGFICGDLGSNDTSGKGNCHRSCTPGAEAGCGADELCVLVDPGHDAWGCVAR